MTGFAVRVGVLFLAGAAGTYWLYVLAVRKRWLFAAFGALLVAWGTWVYAPANTDVRWTMRDGWGAGSAAANKSMSAFFPSRGDYDASFVPKGRGYWAFHTIAIMYMLSLAVAVFGVELVNRALVALRGLGGRELSVVWGLGDECRLIAEGLAATAGKASVVFVVDEDNGGWLAIKEAEGVLRSLTKDGWTWILGRTGATRCLGRARRHFFLGPDGYGNVARAEALLLSLKKRPRRGAVTVHVRSWTDVDDDAVHKWVDKWNLNLRNVGAEVDAVREEAIVSRKFLLDHPMLDAPGVGVDSEFSTVTGEFRVLVAGFGAQGRRLMAEMVADAQFLGPDGRPVPIEVDVADCDGASWGWFKTECAEACERYRIQFHELDIRCTEFWMWLENQPAYNRIVLATQDDAVNLEAAGRVANSYKARFPEMRDRTGKIVFARVRNHALSSALRWATDAYGLFGDTMDTYSPKSLINGPWEDVAVRVNGIWAAGGASLPEDKAQGMAWCRKQWVGTNMLSKESSRASVFHQRNLLRIAGLTLLDWSPTDAELTAMGMAKVGPERVKARIREAGRQERLSEMEHMRWMAFHFVRGWRQWMPTRAELEAIAEKSVKTVKPNALKEVAPLHADLVDYRELKDVDELFNVVNRKHNWKEIKEEDKDRNLIYGVEALLGAGFTVAENFRHPAG